MTREAAQLRRLGLGRPRKVAKVGDVFTVAGTVDGRPLTINRVGQMHRQTWATHTRDARAVWHLLALEAKLPKIGACVIDVVPLHASMASPQDCAACAPEAKAAIDGLRDAGVLADDTAVHVQRVSFLPPRRGCGVDGLELVITVTA